MKSNFCQQPLKLINIGPKGNYQLVEETLSIIENISQPLAIISIGGQYRTGKSYLLNRVVLNKTNGFQVGSTVNSCTKGLEVWGKPLIGKTARGQLINILVIDSEGLGSTEQDVNYDAKLFTLNMLLTSCFIFNSVGAIDENNIQNLSLIAEFIKSIKKDSQTQIDAPQLLWVLRDFSLQLVSQDGHDLTSSQYLQKALQFTQQESRNKSRKLLMNTFIDRDCITLGRPLSSEQNLCQLNKLELQDLRPEFIEQSIAIRKRLLSDIKPKKYFGREVDGPLFCKMIRSYVDILNKGLLPQIQGMWSYISQQYCSEAVQYFEEELDIIIKERINSKLPMNDEDLNRMLQSIESMLLQQLKVRLSCYNGGEESLFNCQQLVSKRFLEIQINNQGKIKQQIEKTLNVEYLMVQKKIGTNQLKNIQDLTKQFQKCGEVVSRKMSIKSNKVTQLVHNISLAKIIQASKLLVHLKTKEIDNLKYSFKQEEVKYQLELRQLKNELQNTKSTSIMEINRLESDRKQIEMKEKNLMQIVEEMRLQRQRLEESMETQSRREKSMSVRTVSEMKFKLDRFNDQNQENQRKIFLMRSQYQKTQALLSQKIQFQERTIQELKQQSQKYAQRAKNLKMNSSIQIKQLNVKLDDLAKIKLAQSKNLLQKISDLESEILKKKDQVQQYKEKCNKMVLDAQFRQDEHRTIIAQMEQKVTDSQNKRIGNQKLIESSMKTEQKIHLLLKLLEEKQQSILQFRNQLNLKQALIAQKIQFYQMQIKQMQRKYNDELSKNEALMNIIGVKQEQLTKQLKQKHSENVKELQAQYSFEINHLKEQLEEVLAKKYQIQEEYSTRKNEMMEEIQAQNDKIKGLQQSKSKIMQSHRQLQLDKTKYLKLSEQRCAQAVMSLQSEIERLKSQNNQEIKELNEKNLEMVKHLKNYYEMEKEKYEKKLLEMQERLKDIPLKQLEAKILELQAVNQALQNQLSRTKEELSSSEILTTQRIKEYQQRVAELGTEVNILKQQKHSYIQESSKDRLRKQQLYTDQIQSLQSTLLSCQGKLDNCYNQLSKKQKEISALNSKRDYFEGQMSKKQQLIDDLRFQLDDDTQNYKREIKEIAQKYYKVSQEFLKYKIESDKELALIRQERQFNSKKMQELQSTKADLQDKLISLKDEAKGSLQQSNEKYCLQIQSKTQLIQKMRKTFKEDENKYIKNIGILEKQKIQLQEQLKLLQLKLNNIMKEHSKYKEDQITQVGDSHEYQDQIKNLKNSLKDAKTKYDGQHSKLLQLQSSYQRDKVLWQNKCKFLQNQRDQAKQDLSDGFKKFQSALSQINKNRGSEDSLEEVAKSMQRKYTLQIQNIKQSYEKKLLQNESAIKILNVDIKKLKSQLAKQKQMYQNKLQQQIQLITLTNNTINQQLSKELLQKDHSHATSRKELTEKITGLQKAVKEANLKVDHLKFGLQKQQAKYNLEKKTLNDTIQELTANTEQLFRENQRYKNKEKLMSKRFIKPE